MKQIAAEESAMSSPEEQQSVDGFEIPDLTGVTGFSYDDVGYNSAGQLSLAQQRQLRRVCLHEVIGMAIAGGIVALTFVAGAYIFASLLLPFVALHTVKSVRDLLAYRAGEVFRQDGNLYTQKVTDDESPDRYFVHIAGWKLEITKDAYLALIPGGPYRIFYIAGPNRAVGGQVLPGWRPLAPPETKKKKSSWCSLSLELG